MRFGMLDEPLDRQRDLVRHAADVADRVMEEAIAIAEGGASLDTRIRVRHQQHCGSAEGRRCSCTPSYEAWVFSKKDEKKIRKTFAREAEAKVMAGRGASRRSPRARLELTKPTTVKEAWEAWYQGAKAGTVRNRSGDAVQAVSAPRLRAGDATPGPPRVRRVAKLAEVCRPDLQEFADGLLAMA